MNVSKMSMVERLKADLRSAMKARQNIAVSTLRSMLSIIDNAGAVEVDTSIVPLSGISKDVPRRELSEAQIVDLLRAEAAARHSAAIRYEQLGKHEEAQRLCLELDVFARYLEDVTPDQQ